MADRTVVAGGDVVTPQGVVRGGSIIVRDGVIEDVIPALPQVAGRVEDATGMVVLPGVVNAHAHGCTTGPLFSSGAAALSGEVATAHLDRHLAGGVTTLVNVCGFAVPDALVEHAIDVRLATNHLPSAFVAADIVDGSGLTSRERAMTARAMIDAGACLIGEVGSGATLGGGVSAYRYVPDAVRRETGIELTPQVATTLIDALVGVHRTSGPDDAALREAVLAVGIPEMVFGCVRRAIMDLAVAPVTASLTSFAEAVHVAERTGVAAMFHAAGPSATTLLELARRSSARLVAGHLNHPSISEEELIGLAMQLREEGVTVDVSSLDMIHAQRLATPERADLLAAEGLVDTLSTDYAGGGWEPMLAVADRWWRRGYADLPELAQMCATRPAQLMGFTDRGAIVRGQRADLVVSSAANLENVRDVYVGGRHVFSS